jgi:Cu(I)/Ag(I) efflux system protein CusF
MKHVILKTTLSAVLFALALGAYAEEPAAKSGMPMHGKHMDCGDKMEDMKGMEGMKMDCGKHKSEDAAKISTGTVQEIDKAAKTVTLKHGPIKNMNMPAMTMSFGVKDAAMLSKVKVGEQVNFTVENVDNAPTVTMIKRK